LNESTSSSASDTISIPSPQINSIQAIYNTIQPYILPILATASVGLVAAYSYYAYLAPSTNNDNNPTQNNDRRNNNTNNSNNQNPHDEQRSNRKRWQPQNQ
jgi:hypothetical protein